MSNVSKVGCDECGKPAIRPVFLGWRYNVPKYANLCDKCVPIVKEKWRRSEPATRGDLEDLTTP